MNATEFHSARRYVHIAAGRIAHLDQGSGPAALLLHGYPLNSFQWRSILPRLAHYRRCVAPDFLGLGYTEPAPGQSYSAQAQAAMLADLLDALDIADVDIITNDTGGLFGQVFATTYPQRVRSLLLTNGDIHENCPPPAFLGLIETARNGALADQFCLTQLQDRAFALSPQGLGGFGYTHPENFTTECAQVYLQPLVSSDLRKQQFHASTTGVDVNPLPALEHDLRRLQAPVRLVWGMGDPFFPIATAEWLESILGNSHGLRRIGGAKLYFPEEMPDIIVAEALALWGETTASCNSAAAS